MPDNVVPPRVQPPPPDDPKATAQPSRIHIAGQSLEKWRKKSPSAKLAAFVWVVLTSGMSLAAFVESYWLAPARTTKQLQEQAIREGWGEDPRVWVSFVPLHCQITNHDVRPIRQVLVSRYVFRIDLTRPCSESAFSGGGPRGYADSLNTRDELPEDPTIGPPLQDVAKEAMPPFCAAGDDCIVAVECRAFYHRAADMKRFTTSGWGIFDPQRQGSLIVPVEHLLSLEGDPPAPRWTDDRYRKTFECVTQQVGQRERLETITRQMLDLPTKVVPTPTP